MEKQRQSHKIKYDDSLKKPKLAFLKLDNSDKIEKCRKKLKLSAAMSDKLRNNHLLSLCGINAIQTRLYKEIFPSILDVNFLLIFKMLDGDFFDLLRDSLLFQSNQKTQLIKSIQHSNELQLEWASAISKEFEVSLFTQSNEYVFNPNVVFSFDCIPNDPSEAKIVVTNDTKSELISALSENCLSSGQVQSDATKISKEIEGLKSILKTYKQNPEFGDFTNSFQELCALEYESFICALKLAESQACIELLESSNSNNPLNVVNVDLLSSNRAASANSIYFATIDYQPSSDSNDLELCIGDEIVVTDKSCTEFWIGINQRTSQQGTFPALFVSSSILSVHESEHSYAIALFDYSASCDGELSFQAGQSIRILGSDTGCSDWWEGELEGKVGQFPISYVSLKNSEDILKAKALFSFEATEPQHLSFSVGQVITILQEHLDDDPNGDWMLGMLGGKQGEVPKVYLEMMK